MRVSEAIDLLRLEFLDRGSSQTTWKTDYWKVLRHLDPDATVTTDLLIQLVERTARNSKSRVRYLMVASQIARVAGVPFNARPLKPQRGKKPKIVREIPTDQEIFDFWVNVNNSRPDWGWIVGMMAAYGLRNHEAFFTRPSRHAPGAIEILRGKTGARTAFALYPEWFQRFRLEEFRIPPVELDRPNDAIGHSVTEFFSRINAPFRPYDLRHAWAIRAHLVFRLSDSVAADAMGHSVDVHQKLYLKWITLAQAQAEIEAAIGQSRPKPQAPL